MKEFMVFLQARLNSSRLPGKVLLEINGIPMIQLQINRILQSKNIDGLVVLIPDTAQNDELHSMLAKIGVDVFRGSENDVLQRYIDALYEFPTRNIVRLTADCPLFMPDILDEMIRKFRISNPDYLSNTLIETYPDGLDVEIFSSLSLRKLPGLKPSDLESEHVTLGLYARPEMFKLEGFQSPMDLSKERWTVDYPGDFEFVKGVFEHYAGKEHEITISDILHYVQINPTLHTNQVSSSLRHVSLNLQNGKKINL
jgi:spore coat polysaccharide biosynthesis protein SpsF